MSQINSPLVEIFNGGNKLLKYPNGDPLGRDVQRFIYEFNEEGDDSCKITIGIRDPEVLNHPALRPDVLIYVRWGYPNIQGGMSRKRLLAIRDTDTQYTTEGIRHQLICSDQVAYLKTMQHNEATREGFASWLSSIGKAKIANFQFLLRFPKFNRKIVTIDSGTDPSSLNELTSYISTARDNTAVSGIRPVVPAGQSVYRVIKSEVEALPDGPYVLDGRDNKLTIRPRGFDRKTIRSYKIASGDPSVKAFTAATEIRKSELGISQYGGVDPQSGTAKTTSEIDTDSQEYRNLLGFDIYLSTAGLSEAEAYNQELAQSLWGAFKFAKDNNIPAPDPNEVLASQKVDIEAGERQGSYLSESGGSIVTSRDNTSVYQRFSNIPKAFFWNAADSVEILERLVQNDIKDKHQRKYKSKLTIKGDPFISVDQTIFISGEIANWHKGKYYINKSSHVIDMKGYITEIDLLKKPVDIIMVSKSYTEGLGEVFKDNEDKTVEPTDNEPVIQPRETFQKLDDAIQESDFEETLGSEDWSKEKKDQSVAGRLNSIDNTKFDPIKGETYNDNP